MTYTYDSGKIERDFVLKKAEGNCHQDPNQTKLIGVMCQKCPYFLKMQTFYPSPKDEYRLNLHSLGTYVFCKFHKKDDEGTEEIIRDMYRKFREEAIKHFYD